MKKFFTKKVSPVLALLIVVIFGYAAIYLMSAVFKNVKY